MKKLVATGASLLSYLSFALPASAQFKICPEKKDGVNFEGLCGLANADLGDIIANIIVLMLIVATLIALFFLIWGGIKWILSGGDKAGVEGARNHVIAAIVGLAVAFLAFLILTVVTKLFGVSIDNLNFLKLY